MNSNPNYGSSLPDVVSDWMAESPGRPAKVTGGILIGIGFLALVTAGPRWFLFFLVVGILVIIVFGSPGSLSNREVIDRWDTLVRDGQGKRAQVIETTLRGIDSLKPPHVLLEQADLAPGTWRGLLGDTRPFLIVSHTANVRLKPYRMYVNVRDYGQTLQTSWFLTYRPTLWQRIRRSTGALDLDLFDEQDLRAYVTAVHYCFLDAVVELLTTLGQDAGELDRSTKGFLGLS